MNNYKERKMNKNLQTKQILEEKKNIQSQQSMLYTRLRDLDEQHRIANVERIKKSRSLSKAKWSISISSLNSNYDRMFELKSNTIPEELEEIFGPCNYKTYIFTRLEKKDESLTISGGKLTLHFPTVHRAVKFTKEWNLNISLTNVDRRIKEIRRRVNGLEKLKLIMQGKETNNESS